MGHVSYINIYLWSLNNVIWVRHSSFFILLDNFQAREKKKERRRRTQSTWKQNIYRVDQRQRQAIWRINLFERLNNDKRQQEMSINAIATAAAAIATVNDCIKYV